LNFFARCVRLACVTLSPSLSSSAYAIEATGLVKRYGEKTALAGVDLDVPRGSVCGLLGPNGAGKTTAVRVLTTLTEPDEGSARVAGHDIHADPVSVRRSIGLAAQDATVDGLLTGRENLVMIGELHHVGRRQAKVRAQELLERFSLVDAGDRLVKEYSGGMRRRLDLAATLVAEPEILFLDEPTTGLDPRARNELWGVLDDLVAGGATILLTTQYLEEADRLADDIVVIDHGRVIARGDARSLKRSCGGDQLHVVCASDEDVALVADIAERVTGARASVDAGARSVTAPTDGGAGAIAALAGELADRDIAVEDLGLRQPTLDDVFLTLTGSHAEAEQATAGAVAEEVR
jgi:ABC-2 type transport system ATP-binding protein